MIESELTPCLLAQSRVIAKGKRIRDIERLMRDYGGKASQWVKKSSPQIELATKHMNIIGTNIRVSGV